MEDRARARVSTPFTWMAASKPQSTLAVVGRLSLEQMNKGDTVGATEKNSEREEKFKTVDATTARRCLRSVGFRGSSQALIECENGSAYKCSDHSVSLVIKLDKIEPASFE